VQERLLKRFLREEFVQFEDPRLPEAAYTMMREKSMKGYPVSLYHSSYQGGVWHPCRGYYHGDNYGLPGGYGYQLAISPAAHYGFPEDKWDGSWTVRGMASLLLHLVYSVELTRLHCGDEIGSPKRRTF
jgi:hypothetical protein